MVMIRNFYNTSSVVQAESCPCPAGMWKTFQMKVHECWLRRSDLEQLGSRAHLLMMVCDVDATRAFHG